MAWPVRSRWVRLAASVFSTAIAIAAIAAFIFLVFVPGCSQTHFAVLAPAPYNDHGLPPYPFAQQDRETFRSAFSADSLPEFSTPVDKDAKGGGGMKAASSSRNPLFIYVAALAGQSDRGIVLYSVDSGPDELEGTISLDRLWEYLATRPAEQKKILAIDLARGPVDDRWGQFVRPSVSAARKSDGSIVELPEAAAKIPNLAVLTAAAPGEVSWTSPALANSAFAHFLVRALSGEADGAAGQPRDYRVTLDEVHKFVLMQTNHWVLQNRDLRGQHPQLLVSGESRGSMSTTVLAEVRGRTPPPVADAARPTDGGLLRRLEALWEAHDKWVAQQPYQVAPLEWRRFQEHLRRAEQWRLAGQPEGMTPHLDEAESTLRALQTRTASQSAVQSPFVVAGLARRTGAAASSTEPLLPERQLAAVFQTFAPEGLPAAATQASLKLRALAEKESWQPYRTRLWTGDLLAKADGDRRSAEDLLFVGGAADLERSQALRGSAESTLAQHGEIVRELSEAHALHSRLLAELPGLAFWAAQRMSVENSDVKAAQSRRFRLMNDYSQGIDQSRFLPPSLSDQQRLPESSDDAGLQQTEIELLLLFQQTRELAQLLDRELSPNADFVGDSDWKPKLQTLRRALTDPEHGLDAIEARLTRHAKGLMGAAIPDSSGNAGKGVGQPQYFHWLRLRNALQWSGLSADVRRALFADLEQSDRTLHSNSQKIPVAAPVEWNGDDWTAVDGCWRSLWTLQSLSLGTGETAMHEHWVDWKNAVVDPAKQLSLLVELGQSVRREYRGRNETAQPSLASAENLTDVQTALLSAVRAERTFHGYDAALFSAERDPLKRLESFDVGALCVAQVDRYADDFWGKSSPTENDAWFSQAAEQCLRTAGRQADPLAIPALKTAKDNADRRLQERRNGRLTIEVPADKVDLSLVSQRAARLTVKRNDQTPPGVAAVWLSQEQEAGLQFVPAGRQGTAEATSNSDWTIRKERTPAAAGCVELAVRPRLLFRGRFWDDDSTLLRVNPCPPDSLEFEFFPAAPAGQIAVFGADRRDTIFIFDCSLSMADPIDAKKPKGETRFQAARKALTEALRVLRDSPAIGNERDPYIVGLMAYGHRARAKGGDYNKTETNSAWPLPIPPAVSDDHRNDFELLTPPTRLLDEKYQLMTQQLDLLQPFGQTPLLGAIQSAARTLFDRQRGGLVVAITDGTYNDDRRDGPRYKALQDFFEKHPELSLHVVAFGIGEAKEVELLTELAKSTQGKFYQAPTGADLANTIAKVMSPRQYSVARDVEPREELFADLGKAVENRPARSYEVRFPGLASMPVRIVGGERLEFDLDFSASRLRHRRPPLLLFRRAVDATSFSSTEPTRFGYLEADYDNTRKTATLQLGMDRDDLLGTIDRPAELRLDIVSRADRRKSSRSLRVSPNLSIPAWQVELRGWPSDAQPEIQAVWKMTRTTPDQQQPLSKLLTAPQKVTLPGWPEQSLLMKAERQPGKLLLSLQADAGSAVVNVADVRVEIGKLSMVEGVFLPESLPWRSRIYETERQVTYEFDLGDGLSIDDLRVALTSAESLNRDARRLESPLVIEKWDREQ